MAQPVINTDALVAEVTKAKGVTASVVTFIQGIGDTIAAKVKEALDADDAADQGSVDAANAAIASAVADLVANNAALANAIVANPGPGPTPTPIRTGPHGEPLP